MEIVEQSVTAHLTVKSRNAKTGPIPVSTTTSRTCPQACPFNAGNGCYAASGPLAMHWRKVDDGSRGTSWDQFCSDIGALPEGQFWRHNAAGDLPGDGDEISTKALSKLIVSNQGKRGFTYTHYPVKSAKNRTAIQVANDSGFTVNLSGDNPAHADTLADLEIAPVATVLPADTSTITSRTPAGRLIATCPATYRDDVSCATCQLCQRVDRKVIVGFPAHGTSKKRADTIASRA